MYSISNVPKISFYLKYILFIFLELLNTEACIKKFKKVLKIFKYLSRFVRLKVLLIYRKVKKF